MIGDIRAGLTKAPRAGGPDYTVVPFACVVCGVPDLRCLCRACRLAHTDAAGRLAPWAAALQRLGQAQSARFRRNVRRLRGQATAKDGRSAGLRFVSLESLTDPA